MIYYNRQEERLTTREEGYSGAEITEEVLTIFSLDYLRYSGAELLTPWQLRHFSEKELDVQRLKQSIDFFLRKWYIIVTKGKGI